MFTNAHSRSADSSAHRRVPPGGQAPARGQPARRAGGTAREREEVRVAPDVLRTSLNATPQLAHVARRAAALVVGDLQRAEAALAHVARLGSVLGPALL